MKPVLTVPGAQLTRSERQWLYETAKEIAEVFPCPTIVNIGVFRGASMWCLRSGAPEATLIGVDIDYSTPVHEKEKLDAELIEMDSNACGKRFSGDVHLLFVDGDHHEATVRGDIKAWCPHVATGGIAAFHDYSPTKKNLARFPHLIGGKRAVNEYFGKGWERLQAPDSLAAFRRTGRKRREKEQRQY